MLKFESPASLIMKKWVFFGLLIEFLYCFQIVNAEWTVLYRQLEKIYEGGAQIILSRLPIGDVATQWFADR